MLQELKRAAHDMRIAAGAEFLEEKMGLAEVTTPL